MISILVYLWCVVDVIFSQFDVIDVLGLEFGGFLLFTRGVGFVFYFFWLKYYLVSRRFNVVYCGIDVFTIFWCLPFIGELLLQFWCIIGWGWSWTLYCLMGPFIELSWKFGLCEIWNIRFKLQTKEGSLWYFHHSVYKNLVFSLFIGYIWILGLILRFFLLWSKL